MTVVSEDGHSLPVSTFGRQPNSFSWKLKVHWCFITVTETAPKQHYKSVSAPKPNFSRSLEWKGAGRKQAEL